MSGFLAFLKKEMVEILRTWKVWVIAGIMLFIGLSSPIMAKVTPALIKSVAGSQPGLVIKVPEPTYLSAFIDNWMKNLTQMMLLAVLIAFAGVVSSEKVKGTAILMLTKPVSRSGFVVAKAVANFTLLVAATVLGGLVCWAGTLIIFDKAPLPQFVAGTGMWLAYMAMITATMVLLSSVVDSGMAAAVFGIVIYVFLLPLASLWKPLKLYSPAGLLGVAGETVAGKHPEFLWPLLTTAVLAVLLVAAAAALFSRREL